MDFWSPTRLRRNNRMLKRLAVLFSILLRRFAMNPSDASKVFDLGARLGSLEGYLYVGKDVEPGYLPGWLDNIENGFVELPPDVRSACAAGFHEGLRKVAAYLQKLYGSADTNTMRATAMMERLQSP
jgi:hypothetical protein